MQVYAKLEPARAEQARGANPCQDFSQAAAFAGIKDLFDVGVPLEELFESSLDDNRNTEVRPPAFEQPERRGHQHDIANGAQPDEQDVGFRRKGRENVQCVHDGEELETRLTPPRSWLRPRASQGYRL